MSSDRVEKADAILPANDNRSGSIDTNKVEDVENSFEVFKKQEGVVDFRTVGWIHAAVIFLKSKRALTLFFNAASKPLSLGPLFHHQHQFSMFESLFQ